MAVGVLPVFAQPYGYEYENIMAMHHPVAEGGAITPAYEILAIDGTLDITSYFQCENFASLIREIRGIDASAPILLSHVNTLTSLFIDNRNIESLEGIEHFTELGWLGVVNSELATLDLSNKLMLRSLVVSHNQLLTTLDISNNPILEHVTVQNNALTTLNASNNPMLSQLTANYNSLLTTLNASNNPMLGSILANNNQLTSIDVSNNLELIQLFAPNNQFTSIDVANITELNSLVLNENYLTTIDVSTNT